MSERPAAELVAGTTVLDNRRTPCAVGLIRAARVIRALPPGALLEIWTRDRVAPVEIPVWVERDGHEVLRQERQGSWPGRYWVFEVRRGGGTAPARGGRRRPPPRCMT